MSAGAKTRKSGYRKPAARPLATRAVAAHEITLVTERPRFLISRMSAIGETILTLPIASALRERFPSAEIIWAAEPQTSPLVRGHDAIDQTVVLEHGWSRSLAGIRTARERLEPLQCDVAIDCQGVAKSGLACYLSGAANRIGFAGRHARHLSRYFSNIHVRPIFQHLTDRTLELLTPLGIHSPSVCGTSTASRVTEVPPAATPWLRSFDAGPPRLGYWNFLDQLSLERLGRRSV